MEVLIGGKYYPGVVKKVGGDGTYGVDFDDGDKDPRVAEEHMRPLGGAPAAEETPAAPSAERYGKWNFFKDEHENMLLPDYLHVFMPFVA